jgi:hypothetical protein
MSIMFDSKEHRSLVAQCWIAVYAASLASRGQNPYFGRENPAKEADAAVVSFVERFKNSEE